MAALLRQAHVFERHDSGRGLCLSCAQQLCSLQGHNQAALPCGPVQLMSCVQRGSSCLVCCDVDVSSMPVDGRSARPHIGGLLSSCPVCHAADGSAAPAADAKPQDALPEGASYEEYDPLLLKQNEGLGYLEFPTYNAALDDFFAKVRL